MGKNYYVDDAIRDMRNFSNLGNASNEQLEDHYLGLFVNTALSAEMSIFQKCSTLERLNQNLRFLINGDMTFYIEVNKKALESSFTMLEQLAQGDSLIQSEVSNAFSKFKTDFNRGKPDSFNEYLLEIFSLSGLLYSPEKTFTVEERTLLKHDLPTFATKRPSNYMVLAIISLVCLPVGLIAIIFASRVKARYNNCNVRGAYKASRYARNLALAGILLFGIYLIASNNNSSTKTSTTNQVMKVQKSEVTGIKTNNLVGTSFKGYDDKNALKNKLGFWSGAGHAYEDGKFSIEIWKNDKLKELWLVLLESSNDKSIVNDYYHNYGTIRDILTFKNTTGGDIGPFQVNNNKTNELSDYMIIQITSDNKLVKIYDVDSKRKKITARDPEAHWGEVLAEWDSY